MNAGSNTYTPTSFSAFLIQNLKDSLVDGQANSHSESSNGQINSSYQSYGEDLSNEPAGSSNNSLRFVNAI